ncbi:Hsp20/alpha crystallin family protein [Paenibacillus sp. GCM10012307]|nr:Hsp20/alpha crystallin family protein [Paenibacillus roseus]
MEKWMEGSGLPNAMDLIREPKLIQNYVNDMISNAVPAFAPSFLQKKSQIKSATKNRPKGKPASPLIKSPRTKSFETHHFVIVKFDFVQEINPEELRLFIRPDKVKLEFPDGRREEIVLPSIVLPDSYRALYKDGILQVKIRKRSLNRRYREAYIRWT